MSIVLTGNPDNITTPISVSITGVSNHGGLFQVSTAPNPHLFGGDTTGHGDTVLISGVTGTGGMTAAINGVWKINVINAGAFDLVGSSFVGAYTSGGTATDLSLTPQIRVPSDGDAASMAAAMLSCLQGILDRTQYLQSKLTPHGSFRLIQMVPISGSGTFTPPTPTDISAGSLTTPTLVGDVVEVSVCGTINLQVNGSPSYPFYAGPDIVVNAVEAGGSDVPITDLQPQVYIPSTAYIGTGTTSFPGTWNGLRTVATAGTWAAKMSCLFGSQTQYLVVFTALTGWLKLWRPT